MTEKDSVLVEQLRRRQEKALHLIVERYGGLIRNIIRHHLGDRNAHDECMDDILMAVWTHIDSYDDSKNSLVNWIAAVAKYKAIDYQRSYARRTSRLVFESPELEHASAEDVYEDSAWDELLAPLSEQDRELFIQHYVRDRSIEELADARGVKHSWIYNRLSRGRKKLRTILHSLKD